jgi:peptide/nickel transport system permease protein
LAVDSVTLAAPAAPARRVSRRGLTLWSGVALLALIVLASLLVPLLSPYDPYAIALKATLRPPSLAHWFGTDQLGRDVFTRTFHGGRVSLSIAAATVFLAGMGGIFLGIAAAYIGGWFDTAVMRLVEVQYALPAVILAILLVGLLGSGTGNVVLVLTLTNWARFARVIRAEAQSLSQRDFVLLARMAGASRLRIILRHIAPNLRSTFFVLLTLDVGLIVILESTLSFLGLGVQPPTPSWGGMIADGRGYLDRAWWTAILPGTVLMLTVVAANLIGDALATDGEE